MAVFNYLRKEIDAKIVYYGPAVSGKTTNLQHVHEHLKQEQRGKMVSLATDEDRTLFFDFLPIELESVRGFKTRFHLYTVPGQVYYGATRRAVLTGVDGVIFVADSQADRLDDNRVSLKDLEENLNYYGKKMESTPFIFQYNKRDLSEVLSTEELNQKLNRLNAPFFEAVAVSGKGVFETLTMACRLVLKGISTGAETHRSPGGMPDSAPKAAAVKPSQTEGSIPAPDRPRPATVEAPPQRQLRLEKDAAPPEPPRPISSGTSGGTLGRAGGLRVEREAPAESPKPTRMSPPPPAARPAAETNPTGARSILSRVAEKKMPEPPPRAEGDGEGMIPHAKEKLRILSCGQPRISPPSSLEIPLTVEVDGFGKSLTFNLAIKLEQLDQKIT
jgi:signal recognition particle receptor subunit beta